MACWSLRCWIKYKLRSIDENAKLQNVACVCVVLVFQVSSLQGRWHSWYATRLIWIQMYVGDSPCPHPLPLSKIGVLWVAKPNLIVFLDRNYLSLFHAILPLRLWHYMYFYYVLIKDVALSVNFVGVPCLRL